MEIQSDPSIIEITAFEFTLKFSLPESRAGLQSYVELLGAAGCDDALIGIGQTSRIALQFDCRDESALDAVSSVIDDMKKVITVANLIEVTPDPVGLTDVGDILSSRLLASGLPLC